MNELLTYQQLMKPLSKPLTDQRKLKFNILLPQSIVDASNIDLRLSLVALKNLQSAVGVHATRIEKELEKRGVSKYIIHQERDT